MRVEERAAPRTTDAGGHGKEAAGRSGASPRMAHEAAPPRREEAIGAEMRSGGRDRDGLGADRKKKKG